MIEFKKPNRFVEKVFIHCSDSDITSHDDWKVIDGWHKERGWEGIGYHYFITKKGELQIGRPLEKIPSAQYGYNTGSIAICVSGSKDFTEKSFVTLRQLCDEIDVEYDKLTFHGHCEVDKNKTCPVFDYKSVLGLNDKGYLKPSNSKELKPTPQENRVVEKHSVEVNKWYNNKLKIKMTNKLLQDNEGNLSSKRVAGYIVLATYLTLSVSGFYFMADIPVNKLSLLNGMGIMMLGLLGVGVIEKFAKKK